MLFLFISAQRGHDKIFSQPTLPTSSKKRSNPKLNNQNTTFWSVHVQCSALRKKKREALFSILMTIFRHKYLINLNLCFTFSHLQGDKTNEVKIGTNCSLSYTRRRGVISSFPRHCQSAYSCTHAQVSVHHFIKKRFFRLTNIFL